MKDCNKRAMLHIRPHWSKDAKKMLGACHERPSMRGIPACSVSVGSRLLPGSKKDGANPALEETLLPDQDDDVLDMDEMSPYILRKVDICWLRIAI